MQTQVNTEWIFVVVHLISLHNQSTDEYPILLASSTQSSAASIDL